MPRGEGGERRTVGSSTFILQGKTLPLELVGSHRVPLPSQGKYRRGNIYFLFTRKPERGQDTGRKSCKESRTEEQGQPVLSQSLVARLSHPNSACLSVCLSVFETHVSNVKENDVIL